MLKLNSIKDSICINKHFSTESTNHHSHKKAFCSIIKPNDSSKNNKLHQQKSSKHHIEEIKNGHQNKAPIDLRNYSDIINYRPHINGTTTKDILSYFELKKLEFEVI